MSTVHRWTGLEAKLLRQALRFSVRGFAEYLGVGTRTVNKWEAHLTDITLRPYMQEVLDTALEQASDSAQARFADMTRAKTPAPREVEQSTTPPMPGGMLPIVVDGRLVFAPFDVGMLVVSGLGAVLSELPCGALVLPDAGRGADHSITGGKSTISALCDDIDFTVLHCGHQNIPEMAETMIRREVLRLASVAGALLVTQPGEPPLDWERLEYFSHRASRLDSVTIGDLARLNSRLWRVFATVKRKRTTLPFVREQLDLLTDALRTPHREDAHKSLCVLAADLFQLAGEIFFDSNQYTHAAHCYTLAVTASKEAKAFDLWACALTRHAFIGIYERQFNTSSCMLELAAGIASRGDSTLSTSQWVQAVRAQSLAGLGELDACQRALETAEQVHQLTGQVHTGGWLRFDGSRLAEERGACYVELGRHDLAEVALMQALDQELSGRRRGSVLIDLAVISAQRRDPERLVMYAGAALDTARQTGSGVIGRKLQSLQDQLVPFLSDRHVRYLNEQITVQNRISAS